MDILIILFLAVIIDVILGDPPDVIHPVAWMGKVISLLEKGGLKLNAAGQFAYGIIMTFFVTALYRNRIFSSPSVTIEYSASERRSLAGINAVK